MAYATAQDLIDRFDQRLLADMASDTGTPESDLSTNARVLAALEDASGRIEAALRSGNRYLPSDLSGLSGSSQSYLKRITCALALGYLVQSDIARLDEGTQKTIEEAERVLDLLRKGVDVFGVDRLIEAGTPKADGPTAVKRQELRLLPTRVRRFYPADQGRLPMGR